MTWQKIQIANNQSYHPQLSVSVPRVSSSHFRERINQEINQEKGNKKKAPMNAKEKVVK